MPAASFQLVSDYEPQGDQGQAIAKLSKSLAVVNKQHPMGFGTRVPA